MVTESVEERWGSLTTWGEHFLGEMQLSLKQKRKRKTFIGTGQTYFGAGEVAHQLRPFLALE